MNTAIPCQLGKFDTNLVYLRLYWRILLLILLQQKCNKLFRISNEVQLRNLSSQIWVSILVYIASYQVFDIFVPEFDFNFRATILSVKMSLTFIEVHGVFVDIRSFINENSILLILKIIVKLHLLLFNDVLLNYNSSHI